MIATLSRIIVLAVVCAALIALPSALTPEPAQSRAQTPEAPVLRAFPISVLNCQTEPSGLGAASTITAEQLRQKYGCEPGVGIPVTVYSFELGFKARCETDAKGGCSVDAPGDPDHKLSVVEHTAELDPGLAPREAIIETANITEFAGARIVNLPVEATPGAESSAARQLLTVNLSGCALGVCTASDVLAQVSPAEITSAGAPWLAPDDAGAVSFDIAPLQAGAIDLMFSLDGQPAITCTDDATGDALGAEWLTETEGSFFRITVPAGGDLTCDVAFGG